MSIHDDARAASEKVYDDAFAALRMEVEGQKLIVATVRSQLSTATGDVTRLTAALTKAEADLAKALARIKELETQTPPSADDPRRPKSVKSETELRALLNIPSTVPIVTIAANDTRMLDAIRAAHPVNTVIALPERTNPWLIDSSLGFPALGVGAVDGPNGTKTSVISNKNLWFEMLRIDRVVGYGPGTILDLSPSTWSAPAQPQPQYTYSPSGVKGASPLSGAQNTIAGSWNADAIMGNFTMRARALGGVAFSSLRFVGSKPSIKRVLMEGSWKGHDGKPNGETAALNFGNTVYLVDGATLISDGGPSPIMVNSSPGGAIRNMIYTTPNHGMLTYWMCSGVHTVEDFELNAVRMGINLEQPNAGFDLRLSRGIIRIPTANNAFHLNGSNRTQSMKVHLGADVKVEGGPFPGKLVAHMYGIQTGTDASGKPIFAPKVQKKSDITWDGGEVVYLGDYWV